MGVLQVQCFILSMYMYGSLGDVSLLENNASGKNGLLLSTVPGKASSVLRDILNQESLVRFSMVQRIQSLFMDAIDNRKDRQVIKTKLSAVAKELKDLEIKSQIMEEENVKLKKKLETLYGSVNYNRNFTIEEISRLNQTELFSIKSKTSAVQQNVHELALKNRNFQNQLDLLNKTIDLLDVTYMEKMKRLKIDIAKNRNNSQNIKQTQSIITEDLQKLKMKDQRTIDKIKILNESQVISFKNHLKKMKERDDNLRNETVYRIKNNNRALTEKFEIVKGQINDINVTVQNSSVDKLTGQLKMTKNMLRAFSVFVNESLDNVRKDLNETNRMLSIISFNLVTALPKGCHSCWDILRKYPSLKGRDGVYTISVASEVKSVYCDMSTDGGGWTAIQRRQDGSTDFYRTWRDYKQGFGDPSKNYWIGNDAIYELTKNKDQELRVELQSFDGAEAYAQYSTFYVGDEDSKYKLTVSGYKGTAGDSLKYQNGMKFSTKDQDNDSSSGNCATSYHGAWWYNSCHQSNLNGEYAQSAVIGGKYPVWCYWKNKEEALKDTSMMIRNKN